MSNGMAGLVGLVGHSPSKTSVVSHPKMVWSNCSSWKCLGSFQLKMILNLHDSIFPRYLQLSEDSEMNNELVTSFKTIEMSSFCLLSGMGEKEKKYYYLQIFNTLKRLNICGGRCLEEATYSLNNVIFCESRRFCEEVASSKDSHRSKMLWRLSIFALLEILLKILNLQQIFRIVKMSMKILYLHWVEGTPQLFQFPGVSWAPLYSIHPGYFSPCHGRAH